MGKPLFTCPECRAGFRRIELSSRQSAWGEYRCPICETLLEVFDGSTEVGLPSHRPIGSETRRIIDPLFAFAGDEAIVSDELI